jgi:hypothetical protein
MLLGFGKKETYPRHVDDHVQVADDTALNPRGDDRLHAAPMLALLLCSIEGLKEARFILLEGFPRPLISISTLPSLQALLPSSSIFILLVFFFLQLLLRLL